MDKRTILRVFGEAFLRSMVVLMAIAIIGFSTFFVIKVNADKKALEEQSASQNAPNYSEDELHAMLEKENANDTKDANDTATTEETSEETTEAATEQQTIPSNDKNILVLNSTSVAGLASAWMDKFVSAGFANTAIGNYDSGSETQTKIYVREAGMGEDLAQYFNDAVIIVDALDSASYTIKGGASMDTIDIFVVVGNNDTTVQ